VDTSNTVFTSVKIYCYLFHCTFSSLYSLPVFFSGERLNRKCILSFMLSFRFGRGVKTLGDLLKQARAGRVVNEEDIPPPVVTSTGKKDVQPFPLDSSSSPLPQHEEFPTSTHLTPLPPSDEVSAPPHPSEELPKPSRPAPPVPARPPPALAGPPLGVPLPGLVADSAGTSTVQSAELTEEDTMTLNMLKERQDLYKRAALQAKRAGNTNLAIQYIRTAKVSLLNVAAKYATLNYFKMSQLPIKYALLG
jgi:hypothetical protein